MKHLYRLLWEITTPFAIFRAYVFTFLANQFLRRKCVRDLGICSRALAWLWS
uniref:Macaca fascicularis brain cDNA, clone: QflA-21267 n=2 Tax=Cercopithecinae TaxID=9528 RepID=I7GNI5_MACFA|nr:unnamed protein product [Macaca fascicularis]